eukprot:jgi/Ulvmu1/6381/UM003_0009.1
MAEYCEDQLVGGEGQPPRKTDRILRSYSKKERKPQRPRWRVALQALLGGTLVASGVPMASCGIGVLLTCIRTGTLLTSCAMTYTGAKCVVAGTDQLRRVLDESARPMERGTTARAWVTLIGATACMSTTAALLPLFERCVRLYMRLVHLARGNADDLRFQLQSRKLLVNSADQVERAARTVFGSKITEKVQEQIDAAVGLAENVTDGMLGELTSDEARRIITALMFKLTGAYIICGAVLLGPTFLNLFIMPRIARPLSRLPGAAAARYHAWVTWVVNKTGPRSGHFLAAAGHVAVILLAAKPFGLLGERLAALPSVYLNITSGLNFLPDAPKVKVKPIVAVESDNKSSIPRALRWFFQ